MKIFIKKNLSLSTTVLFLFSTLAVCAVETSVSVSPQINKTYVTQIVKLQTVAVGGSEFMFVATGFPIDKHRIMTAGHFCAVVLEGQKKGVLDTVLNSFVVSKQNKIVKIEGGQIQFVDRERDLCLMYFENHGLVPLSFSQKSPVIGDPIVITGAPIGVYPVTVVGRVISPSDAQFDIEGGVKPNLLVSGSAINGNSGGPIINNRGKVIGIIKAVASSFHHIVIAVPLVDVYDFLKDVKMHSSY